MKQHHCWCLEHPQGYPFSTWPCKTISHILVSSILFHNPTHKTKTGTANRWETTNSKPLGPMANQKQWAVIISYLSYSSLAGAQLCCALYQPQQIMQKMRGQNHFPEPNQHILTLLHPLLMGHIWALLGTLLDEQESCLAKYINPVDHGEQVHTGMFTLVQE